MTEPAAGSQRDNLSLWLSWGVILGIVGLILVRNTIAYRNIAKQALTDMTPEPNVQLEITSRMVIGEANLLLRASTGATTQAATDRQKQRMVAAIDKAAVSAPDKLNEVAVIGELLGSERALAKVAAIRPQLAANPSLTSDADTLHDIYMHGTGSISAGAKDGLLQRHGWFGQLALSFGQPTNDPARQTLMDAATQSTIIMGLAGVALLVLVLTGLVLLILGIVFLSIGHLRLAYRPAPPLGPPVYLETFALWLLMWFIVAFIWKLLRVQLSSGVSETIMAIFSGAVALWPLWRGWSGPRLREELGWHTGRGALWEIGAGLVGYIAGLPIIAIGFSITALLVNKSESHPTHPIVREIARGGPLEILGIYLAACVLAPPLEETMFRGALYGHLRRSSGFFVSAIIVSFLFAAIHPQGWTVIPLLGSIAIVLAMLREWRGSLLASMTGHALNNAFGVTLVLVSMR